ncbi:unnamed protein product [Notodromas monacha]|uniref:Uncharacterized protein n=1 Tax=Notodromas monacha TaxID=399045 RepID=A0A7R9BZP5_9CRUS|nr:unnamed protein product [Notodromas monacha]CAG0923538.1 unnamed protein product [Notodromas monacha]
MMTLNVTHCSLTKADVICLGEVLHRNSSLDSLRVQGLSKIDHIFPLVIGLQENTSLQLLDISSSHVTMTDFPFQCFVQILTRIRSLKSLNISGWTVKLEEARSLHCLGSFLKTCTIRDLNLAGCKIFVSVEDPEKGKYDSLLETLSKGLQPYPECEVAFLNLSGCQVIMMTSRGQVSLQASDLIPFLSPLAKLTSLNASLKRGNDPVCKIGEKTIINFFQSLGSKLSNLRRLTISNWSAQIENSEKASKVIAKSLKQLDLKALTVNRLQVVDGLGQKSLSHIFLSTLLLGLPQLTYFSIKGTVMSVEEAAVVARCIAERHKGPFLDLSVRHFPPEVLKEFRAVLIASGKVFPSVIRCAACHNEELRIELRPAQNTGVWDAFACSLK